MRVQLSVSLLYGRDDDVIDALKTIESKGGVKNDWIRLALQSYVRGITPTGVLLDAILELKTTVEDMQENMVVQVVKGDVDKVDIKHIQLGKESEETQKNLESLGKLQ